MTTLSFGPNGDHKVVMETKALTPNQKVVWACQSGPWVNTEAFSFDLLDDERGVALLFEHSGWPESDDFFAHCNAKWGFFLTVSLKDYLEKGKGQPHPGEPSI